MAMEQLNNHMSDESVLEHVQHKRDEEFRREG